MRSNISYRVIFISYVGAQALSMMIMMQSLQYNKSALYECASWVADLCLLLYNFSICYRLLQILRAMSFPHTRDNDVDHYIEILSWLERWERRRENHDPTCLVIPVTFLAYVLPDCKNPVCEIAVFHLMVVTLGSSLLCILCVNELLQKFIFPVCKRLHQPTPDMLLQFRHVRLLMEEN